MTLGETEDEGLLWVQVPTDLAQRLDRWAELLREAWILWRRVAMALVAGSSSDSHSQATQEDAYLMAQHPDWGENQGSKAGRVAGKLIDAAAQYALGLGALIKDRQLVLAPGPLLRAESEHLARACWIIDPDVAPPEGRVARTLLEHLHGAYQLRRTEDELGNKVEAKRARKFREQIRAEIERRFPGARTAPPKGNEQIDWEAGGEKYPTLQAAARRFEQIFENKTGGMYAVLSHISHPNTHELDLIVEWDPKHRSPVYRVDGESIITQVGNAAVMLNLATSLVALYFGLDQDPLAAWLAKAVEVDSAYFTRVNE